MKRNALPAGGLEKAALATLGAFTAVTLAGYAVYGLHPERLPGSGLATAVYRVAFQGFAQLHIVLSLLVLAVVLVRRTRARWIPAFLAVCILAFLAEHVGTGYGIPFGGYAYTGLLGVKVGGRVPLLIPPSWFVMALPSFVLAAWALPGPRWALGRILIGSLLLVSWDLALDPAMSWITSYWRWEAPGPYYGMPTENLVGWFLTGLALMTTLELSNRESWIDRIPVGWAAAFYLVVLALPLGMSTAAGLWGVPPATLAGLGLTAGVAWSLGWRGFRPRTTDSGTAGGSPGVARVRS